MSAYEEIKSRTSSGQVRIIYIDALPRSVSTLLERVLFHAADVQVNEPFFNSRYNGSNETFEGLERGCKTILEAIDKAQVTGKQPITVIVKDVAKSIPETAWPQWLDVTDCIISLVRDPHIQIYSLMQRIMNDHVSPESDNPSTDTFRKNLDTLARTLRVYGTCEMNTTSWAPMKKHIEIIDKNPLYKRKHMIVDGSVLQAMPQSVLSEVCSRTDLSYSDTLISNLSQPLANNREWRKASVMKGGKIHNAWINRAIHANAIQFPDSTCLPLDNFPAAMQDHLESIAIPTYVYALNHENALVPKKLVDVINLAEKEDGGFCFSNRAPITSYVLIKGSDTSAPEKAKKQQVISGLREESPHIRAFDRIDAIHSKHALAAS